MTKSHEVDFVSSLPRNSRNALRVILAHEHGAAKLREALGMREVGVMAQTDRATGLARAGGTIELFRDAPQRNWRQSMRTCLIAMFVLVATAGFSQAQATLHVQSVHKETPAENGGDRYHSIFEHTVVTGTVGNRVYSLESSDNRSFLEVGQDYPAKIGKSTADVEIPGKKRPVNIRFDIVTVSESETK